MGSGLSGEIVRCVPAAVVPYCRRDLLLLKVDLGKLKPLTKKT